MEFGKPEGGVPTPKREDALRALAEENRMQDSIIGLHEWDREVREAEHGIDSLTGLKTRDVFMEEIEKALAFIRGEVPDSGRDGGDTRIKEASVLFLDLDNFKQVNDMNGHLTGDEVLKKVAKVLQSSARDTDVVARFGGDEFYLFLPRTSEGGAQEVGEKILKNLRQDEELKGYGVGASIGVSSSHASTDATELVHFADMAAKQAKQAGKNQVVTFVKEEA